MNWQIVIAVLYLALGAILIWLGIVILRENSKSRINRITSLMLWFAGLGPVFAAIGATLPSNQANAALPTTFPYSLFFLWELFFPQLLLFSFYFPIENPLVERFPKGRYLIFTPHLFHWVWITFFSRLNTHWGGFETDSSLIQTALTPVDWGMRVGAYLLTILSQFHLKFFSVVNLVYIAGTIWALRQGYGAVTNRRLRNQVGIILRGIQLSVGLYAVAFILPNLGIIRLYEPLRVALTISALLIGSGAIAWSIIRYQFLDIRLIVRQSVVFTVSSALLVGLYLLVITQVAGFIRTFLEIDTPLVDAAFVLFVLIFFQPLKNRIDDLIARLFLRDQADPRAILEAFSRQISSVFDVGDLKKHVLALMTDSLFIDRAFFADHDQPRHRFILDLAGLAGEGIDEDDWFFEEALRRGRPAAFEEFVFDRPLTPMTEILSRWACRLVVPIIDRGQLTSVLVLGEKVSGYKYTVEDVNLLATMANQLAVAITNARLYQDALDKQKLEEELNVARQIQRNLLPRTLPTGPYFEVAAFSQPSRQVGGDFYDFFDLPGQRLGLVIADVSGKGLGAALLVSQLQAILKSEVRNRRSIAESIGNTNTFVTEITSAEQFATMVYAELDPAAGALTYANAGHNYPIVVRRDGSHARLESGGLVLGVIPDVAYEVSTLSIQSGDVIFLFTDGLSDLEAPDGDGFGEERIVEMVIQNRHLTPERLAQEVVRHATEFSAGELGFDDLTFVVLKIS